MALSYRDLFFGGTTFCCCLPERVGVLIMSSTIVVSVVSVGVLSIVYVGGLCILSTVDGPHRQVVYAF